MSTIASLEVDKDLKEMFSGVLEEHSESADDKVYDPELWQQFSELGLQRLTAPEESGGSGATWAEAQALISELARAGVRSPYAENDLLAGWVAGELNLELGNLMTVAELRETSDGAQTLVADRVPWASQADRIVLIFKNRVASVEAASIEIEHKTNNIGEPRDRVTLSIDQFESASAVTITEETLAKLRLKQAMTKAISVTAALEKALEVSMEHVTSRKQFGRPIAKFQAVQNLLADIAGETALARAATDAALLEAINEDWQSPRLEFLVAVARSSVGHSASVVVRNAHQAHGAIGTTIEHQLHKFTRAALAWRAEYGSVGLWDQRVSDMALAADDLWSLIAD